MVLDLGTVISVKDGVVRASGSQKVLLGESPKIFHSCPLAGYNGYIKRTMFTSGRNALKQAAAATRPSGQRFMGHYRPVNIPHSAVGGNGKKLPHNDHTHIQVQDTRSGSIVGKFTKTPKSHFKSTVISPTEYADGTPVPPGESGQSFAHSPKRVEESESDTKPVVHPVNSTTVQAYLDKYEAPIDSAVALAEKTNPQIPKMIVNKENSIFYHENGTRDRDEKEHVVKKVKGKKIKKGVINNQKNTQTTSSNNSTQKQTGSTNSKNLPHSQPANNTCASKIEPTKENLNNSITTSSQNNNHEP